MSSGPERPDVLVLGAGISGLVCTRALVGVRDVGLLEASARPGGLVRTVWVETPVPLRYEAGPESLLAAPEIDALAGELGVALGAVPQTSRRRFLVHRHTLVEAPLGPGALLRSPLLSWRGKLRLLSEPWRSSGTAVDGSVKDFVTHRLGREALEALVDPLLSGIHAGDPAELSMRACFPRFVEGVETHGSLAGTLRARRRAGGKPPGLVKPRGGMEALTSALARDIGERLRLDTPVETLERTASGFALGSAGARLEARQVVLALPVAPTTRLLGGVAPEAARALATLRCEDLASVIVLHRRASIEHPLDGFGYLVPAREGLEHLGTLFCSSIDPDVVPEGFVLLRILVGGARHPDLASAPEERLLALVQREVGPLLGLHGDPEWSTVWRHPGALPRFDLAHPGRIDRLESTLPPGLTVLGNFTRGIGLPALIHAARAAAERLATVLG